MQVGDIVHVKGRVIDVSRTDMLKVKFSFFADPLFVEPERIVYHEPAPPQLKVGDTVLSKDGAQGVIRYIETDWAVVVETEKRKTIRYLCDVQLLVGV